MEPKSYGDGIIVDGFFHDQILVQYDIVSSLELGIFMKLLDSEIAEPPTSQSGAPCVSITSISKTTPRTVYAIPNVIMCFRTTDQS